jgi:hypothetical protein
LVAPAFAAAAFAGIIGFLAGSSLPGDTLYPVRDVLGRVGLTHSVKDDVGDRIERATQFLTQAENAFGREQLPQAEVLAMQALGETYVAEDLLRELDNAADLRDQVADLQANASKLLDDIVEAKLELVAPDNSGPGSVNSGSGSNSGSGGGDDNSGPGSGSDDSSGSGSGSDDGGGSDDSSGPGSGGSDDSSGSGSGSDDSSGPGSGGIDDSSGPGSGGSDDRREDEADARADAEEEAAKDAEDAAEDAAKDAEDEADGDGSGSGSGTN